MPTTSPWPLKWLRLIINRGINVIASKSLEAAAKWHSRHVLDNLFQLVVADLISQRPHLIHLFDRGASFAVRHRILHRVPPAAFAHPLPLLHRDLDAGHHVRTDLVPLRRQFMA